MQYGLRDFFSGIIYVFVIFLPGALLLAVCFATVPAFRSAWAAAALPTAGGWLAFLGGSFLVGHLVSLIASTIEDLGWRGGWKRWRKRKEIGQSLRRAAESMVYSCVPREVVGNNARHWAALILRERESPAYRDVERKDADRRFFRNLQVVLPVSLVLLILAGWPGSGRAAACTSYDPCKAVDCHVFAAVVALLWILSFSRYVHQDGGYTRMAFESLLVALPPREIERTSSWELRWFGEGSPPQAMVAVFRRSEPEERTDFYALDTGDETGIKLREGGLEIKSRLETTRGRGDWELEHWTKLRVEAAAGEPGQAGGRNSWLKVGKRRRVRKFRLGRDGAVREVPPDDRPPAGCQLELTELSVYDEASWTLGFESFGPEDSQRETLERCVAEALPSLGEVDFGELECAGYPVWIRKRLEARR